MRWVPIDENFVSRVSIPGVLTTRTRRLYSGQEVPVVVAQARNLFTWNETALVNAVVAAVERDIATASPPEPAVPREQVALTVRNFLDKIYYQLRNLGQSPPDRALNYAATNAFIFADGIRKGLLSARYVPGPGHRSVHAGYDQRRQEPLLPYGLRLLGRSDHLLRPGGNPPGPGCLPVHGRRQRGGSCHPGSDPPVP